MRQLRALLSWRINWRSYCNNRYGSMKFNPKMYLGLYALLLLAALPLAMRLVPPNRWYGFRFPGQLIDPMRWYEVNALGGRLFGGAMAVGFLLNLALIWLAPKESLKYINWLNISIIVISWWLVSLELVSAVR